MPSASEHHNKAKDNLALVGKINNDLSEDYWDWQVTIVFYSALHIVNSYLAKKLGIHYQTHEKVNQAINPFSMSPGKIEEEPYASYNILKNLSKRARYLVHEKPAARKKDAAAHPDASYETYEKHFSKSIYHYEIVAKYFHNKHKISIPPLRINCSHLTPKANYEVKTQ